jgi:hypothetical protein
MFRKIIIRLCFVMLTLSGILLAIAAKTDRDSKMCQVAPAAADHQEAEDQDRKEFIIWESFARSFMSSVRF